MKPERRANTDSIRRLKSASHDPEVLRAALIRESIERRRAECSATMQTEVVKLALDLLVREPDIEGFFGGLAKTMVEESESHTCAVWLIDESEQRCELWLAYVKDRLFTPPKGVEPRCTDDGSGRMAFPCESMASHLFEYAPGWAQTIEYQLERRALADPIREFATEMDWQVDRRHAAAARRPDARMDDGVQRAPVASRKATGAASC